MKILRQTHVEVVAELAVHYEETILNSGTKDQTSNSFVTIGNGSSGDFRLPLDTKEDYETFIKLHEAIEIIAQQIRGW